jgi:hypothetical protein
VTTTSISMILATSVIWRTISTRFQDLVSSHRGWQVCVCVCVRVYVCWGVNGLFAYPQ